MPVEIKTLKAVNIKGLKDIELAPAGANLYIIGGKNGAGKSSAIDAVWYAIGGKPADKMPIRRGETTASVFVDLGDLKAERRFWIKKEAVPDARGDYSLKDIQTDVVLYRVDENGQKLKYGRPQETLDKLLAKMADDPEEFEHLKPGDQVEIVTRSLGIDFTETDQKIEALKDDRRTAHTLQSELEARLRNQESYPDAPKEEVSAAGIAEELRKANEKNQGVLSLRSQRDDMDRRSAAQLTRIGEQAERIESLRRQLDLEEASLGEMKVKHDQSEAERKTLQKQVEAETLVDTAELESKFQTIEDTNRQVRANKAKAEGRAKWQELEQQRVDFNLKIDTLEKGKKKAIQEALKSADIPIEGELTLDEKLGIFVGGIPFAQVNKAERIKISVGIVLAQKPQLRWVPIRNGGNLDKDNIELLRKVAEELDAMIWMERPSTDLNEVSVVIEDGHLARPLQVEVGGAS